MTNEKKDGILGMTRRDFIKTTSVASMATLAAAVSGSSGRCAGGSDAIRIGVIGCGGRGTGAAIDAVNSSPGVEILALFDPFQDRIDKSLKTLREKVPAAVKVTPETCFTGLEGYKKLLAIKDINYIVTAAPPGFRPIHLKASIEAGKNVFMEKPVAVDPVGVRSVIASSELAAKKGLAIVAGTQRRHQQKYLEVMKRIHDGAIGEVVGGQCYWNQGELWVIKQTPEMSDMEWQCRNWLYFSWTSGDHIVEQHVHNIDVMNWAFGATPVKVMGMGGRQVRTAPEYGNIFDHFAVEFEYPNGARVMSMCRQ
ncbi:MAG: Gfo/Idh/MocA family oxidoreductase, partial [Candidatus Aminicenantes bacterium]|nr:Gfo/Idh/MocA family oxidoreductase [Candidatus Aminicenantes bacterium]